MYVEVGKFSAKACALPFCFVEYFMLHSVASVAFLLVCCYRACFIYYMYALTFSGVLFACFTLTRSYFKLTVITFSSIYLNSKSACLGKIINSSRQGYMFVVFVRRSWCASSSILRVGEVIW